MTIETVGLILRIIVIDIVLSGDNAVVIAMAAHKLPAYQRKRAIMWGGGIAIFLRIVFTMIMSFLLMLPGLQLIGGLVLMWIACKLLMGEEEDEITPDNADQGALAAIRMIFIADLMMSLDNMLAVAGASHNDQKMLIMGLLISIAIIMTCSNFIARLMNRFKWIVYLGAGILAFTAGEMMMGDREVAGFFIRSQHVKLNSHWDQWLSTDARVTSLDTSKLPEDLRKVVRYENQTLTVIGPLTEEQHKILLAAVPEESAAPATEGQGGLSRLWHQLTAGKTNRAAVQDLYDKVKIQPVPSWVPESLRPKVELWFQHKWPAENYHNVQNRDYSVVAWLVYAAAIGICLSAPRWWPSKKSGHTDSETPSPASEAAQNPS